MAITLATSPPPPPYVVRLRLHDVTAGLPGLQDLLRVAHVLLRLALPKTLGGRDLAPHPRGRRTRARASRDAPPIAPDLRLAARKVPSLPRTNPRPPKLLESFLRGTPWSTSMPLGRSKQFWCHQHMRNEYGEAGHTIVGSCVQFAHVWRGGPYQVWAVCSIRADHSLDVRH